MEQRYSQRISQHSSFTLVELLVVIAILAVLMSLVLRAAAYAQRQANRIQCINNLRQVGFSLLTYPQDYNGSLIPADLRGEVDSWINFVGSEYGVSGEYFRCLQESRKDCFNPYGGGSYAAGTAVSHASYIMNAIHRENWNGALIPSDPARTTGWSDGTTTSVHSSALINPHLTIYVCDAKNGISSSDARGIVRYNETGRGPGANDRDVAVRHSMGFNALLGDGHVQHFINTLPENWAAAEF
ncbi:MAG: prepilin-type N-terminal cleavage/methylation domain-containing protein [Lentisphaeria bacterium]